MVIRIKESCLAIQRRIHKVLWNGGAILPALSVYNVLDKHDIPCSVVSGYYRPPVFWLTQQVTINYILRQSNKKQLLDLVRFFLIFRLLHEAVKN
jgi:hypothetical protein